MAQVFARGAPFDGSLAAVPAIAAAAKPDPDTQPPFNPAEAQRRLGGRRDRLDRMLQGFLRDFTITADRAAAAFAVNDWEQLGEDVHMVKGAAGYLIATPLIAAAEAFEQARRNRDELAMGYQAFVFIERLRALLGAIQSETEARAADAPESMTASFDATAVRGLLERLAPLLAGGDYTAVGLIDEVARSLNGHPAFATLQALCRQFDDLDIESARQSLSDLCAELDAKREDRS